ncbi:MAG: hypothetical protein IPJ34_25655 [Myxococcales bacterium]|nr:hypothetical protein [Myxococcales bacterium]
MKRIVVVSSLDMHGRRRTTAEIDRARRRAGTDVDPSIPRRAIMGRIQVEWPHIVPFPSTIDPTRVPS